MTNSNWFRFIKCNYRYLEYLTTNLAKSVTGSYIFMMISSFVRLVVIKQPGVKILTLYYYVLRYHKVLL